MKIDVGLQQLERETSSKMIAGLSTAIKEEVDNLLLLASKLTMESLNCLYVPYKGEKILYFSFLSKISDISDQIVQRGGHPLI